MHVKKEIRVLGVDDGYFDRSRDKETILVGVVMRGGQEIDGVLSTKITVDGMDVTDKLCEMILNSRHYKQLRVVMTNGITFAGFNVLDIHKLYERTKLPVIVIIRKYPDFEGIRRALMKFNDWKRRWEIISKAGNPKEIVLKDGTVYYQFVGLDEEDVRKIIKITSVSGSIPEPVRVAHLIAEGITLGESKGKP